MGRSTVILLVLLLLVVGAMFFFNSQAVPEPTQTIETPVSTGDAAESDA